MVYKKSALALAKEYDWNTEYQYFEYIVNSLINRNRDQVRNLFNAMNKDSKSEFLNTWCNGIGTGELFGTGYIKSIRNICIHELIYS